MGLFGKRKPPLPDYSGVGLEGLLADPHWAYAVSQAGIDVPSCEVVLRLSDATVGTGLIGGLPVHARPAILFGQGTTLAIAFPSEQEVKVVTRDKSRAEVQTQRSGWFQILFGPAENLDGFMFWDTDDDLRLGTKQGEMFGQCMLAFIRGQLAPGQVSGTPQSLISESSALQPQPSSPAFDDPQDELRWDLLHTLHATLAAMMSKNSECFEKAELAERGYAVANAEYVDGVRQHEISKDHFRRTAERLDSELAALLHELRELTLTAQAQWKDLVFLLPPAENDVMQIGNWCATNGVDSAVMSSLLSNSVFLYTDFGLTREAFWAENNRIAAVMNAANQ